MRVLQQRAKAFLKAEDGPTAVEYAVLLSLIIVTAMPAITALGERVRDIFIEVADALPEPGFSV